MQDVAHAPEGQPVTLDEVLERREARVVRRQRWLARFGRPLVSLTLVNPGPVKNTSIAHFVFGEGVAAIDWNLAAAGYTVLAKTNGHFVTGPEGMCVVDADAIALKRALIGLEDGHPLGRLWDADVIHASGASVSRRQLGMAPRTCLVCDQPAHACSRAGTHALADLQRAIKERVDAYRSHRRD